MDEPSGGTLRFSGHWILTNVFVTQADILARVWSNPTYMKTSPANTTLPYLLYLKKLLTNLVKDFYVRYSNLILEEKTSSLNVFLISKELLDIRKTLGTSFSHSVDMDGIKGNFILVLPRK